MESENAELYSNLNDWFQSTDVNMKQLIQSAQEIMVETRINQ